VDRRVRRVVGPRLGPDEDLVGVVAGVGGQLPAVGLRLGDGGVGLLLSPGQDVDRLDAGDGRRGRRPVAAAPLLGQPAWKWRTIARIEASSASRAAMSPATRSRNRRTSSSA
jgi:hypothetical protein